MASLQNLTREGVLGAIAEFDELGRDVFLEKHGYARARSYLLIHAGKEYDSKAIVGVAHGYDFPESGPLHSRTFSGGSARVATILEKLGFSVSKPVNLPKWWVNQGVSYNAERDESFIWAPQVTKSGRPVGHHTAVSDVKKGDVIVHYSNKYIRAIGTATSDGYAGKKPESLANEAWETEGWRADVDYRELNEPIPLENVPEPIRLSGEGPFTTVGGVRQGYLFELPGKVRVLIAGIVGGNSSPSTRVGGVYVGDAGAVNLRVGLGAETWGWATSYVEQSELEVGDLFLLAFGGGGRVKIDAWVEKTAKEIHLCRVTKPVYEEQASLWPDETDEQRYPYRIGIEVLGAVSDFAYSNLPIEVNKLFQTSSTKQGRVFVADLESVDQLLATFGVIDMTSAVVPPNGSIEDVVTQFSNALKTSHVNYGDRHEGLVRRFVVSLATKRFLILTGLSGSGKTKLAQAFGQWLGHGRSRIVAVRPDWTSPDHLLGYRNDLADSIGEDQPWESPETLQLILEAVRNPNNAYLLILDEMNLAHVERYFADVLSGIESNAPVIPNIGVDGVQDRNRLSVPLPSNLFIVGTVNVDETTYMFSPKVLDRANTIEFRVETDDLGRTDTRPTTLEPGDAGHVARFLADSRSPAAHASGTNFADWTKELHALLSKSSREFGHRSYAEMMEFRHHFLESGGDEATAFDVQVFQKVLPRIHGSQRDVGPTIEALAEFCFFGPGVTVPEGWKIADATVEDAHLGLSFEKVQRMWRRLRDTHFVAFAE